MEIFQNAAPIWTGDDKRPNVYAEFRETVQFDGHPVTLTISADTQYAVYLRGKLAATGQYTDYPDAKVYEQHDLTPFLQIGENELFMTVYCQNTASSAYRPGKPYVIYTVTAGEKVLCASGESTLCRRHPRFQSGPVEKVSGQLGFSFRYSATQKETPWERAQIVSGTPRHFSPRPIKQLLIGDADVPCRAAMSGSYRERENSEGETVGTRMQCAWLAAGRRRSDAFPNRDGAKFTASADADGVCILLDLGVETVGFLSFDLDLPKDCEILIGWGEHLDDGRVRTEIGGRNFAAQYLAHAGRNQFFNPFRRLGLRYLQLHIASPEVTVYYAGVRTVEYPLPAQRFHCADGLHERILTAGIRTLKLCMHEHYEDCPWREQAMYAMDSRNQMLCGYYAFGEYRFPRAALALMAHSLREDGLLELCSPADVPITIPSFTAVWVCALEEYLAYSGDAEFVRQMLPTARRIAEGFWGRIEPCGLIAGLQGEKYWNFYEWQDGLSGSSNQESGRTYDAPLCAFVSLAFGSLARICRKLGEADAHRWAGAQKTLNQAMHTAFYQEEKGVYTSFISCATGERSHYAALTQSLFLCAGACPENIAPKVRAQLAANAGLLPVTLSYSIFRYEALLQEAEKYGDFVRREVESIWGDMLAAGAGTFWETKDGADDFYYAGSLCHGWSAVPVYLYGRYAGELGIRLV